LVHHELLKSPFVTTRPNALKLTHFCKTKNAVILEVEH